MFQLIKSNISCIAPLVYGGIGLSDCPIILSTSPLPEERYEIEKIWGGGWNASVQTILTETQNKVTITNTVLRLDNFSRCSSGSEIRGEVFPGKN